MSDQSEQKDVSSQDQSTERWQIGKSIRTCLKLALDNELWCDVTITIHSPEGTTTKIRAHELILKAGSPVFESMLDGNFAESNSKEINLRDTEVHIVKDMIRYMYTDTITVTIHNVLGLRNLAKMYMLNNLERRCNRFVKQVMKRRLSMKNVCSFLTESLKFDLEDVLEQCLSFFGGPHHAIDILKSKSFLHLPYEAVLTLVNYEGFVNVEGELLKACLRWGRKKQECSENDLRTILDKITFQIRYHQLTLKEFNSIIDGSSLLLHNEVDNIRQVIRHETKKSKETLSAAGFNMDYRIISYIREYDPRYFEVASDEDNYHMEMNGNNEVLMITPSEPIMFHGIGVLSGNRGCLHEVSLEVREYLAVTDTYRSMHGYVPKESASYISRSPLSVCQALLPEPIRLEAGKEYQLDAQAHNNMDIYEHYFIDKDILEFKPTSLNCVNFKVSVKKSAQTVTCTLKGTGEERKSYPLAYIHMLYVQPCT